MPEKDRRQPTFMKRKGLLLLNPGKKTRCTHTHTHASELQKLHARQQHVSEEPLPNLEPHKAHSVQTATHPRG